MSVISSLVHPFQSPMLFAEELSLNEERETQSIWPQAVRYNKVI